MSEDKPKEPPEKGQLPPYVPFKTFKNWIEGLRALGGSPSRIDRSVMPTMSGATQGQLTAALRYLGLVSQNGTPSEALGKLVEADGEARREILHDVLVRSYPFLFQTVEFNPRTATISQLIGAFQETGATGQTVRKCVAFLLLAAQEAGMPLSPYFKGARPSRTAAPRRRPAPTPPQRLGDEAMAPQSHPVPPQVQAGPALPKPILGALAQLPEGEATLTEEEINDLVTVYRIALKRTYLSR